MSYISRITEVRVLPDDVSLFSELSTMIGIEDDGDGEYVIVRQMNGSIKIDVEEWSVLRDEIGRMISNCKVE